MRLKTVVLNWVHKFICGWLIFCIGGLAPLTFNTPLSPHRDVPTVYIALFDSLPQFSFTAVSSDPLAVALKQIWRTQVFNHYSAGHTLESFMPSRMQFFQSNLGNGYLLTAVQPEFIPHLSLFGFIALSIFSGRSAVLPPLEKPPQFLFA